MEQCIISDNRATLCVVENCDLRHQTHDASNKIQLLTFLLEPRVL